MSQHLFNDTDITAIANAIRTKKGTQNTMTITQMPSEIASIPSGGGTDYMAQRVQGTLSSYEIPNTCTKVIRCAFYQLTSLTSITIPNTITTIGSYAFAYCSLTSLNLPGSLITIDSDAFEHNTSLTSITFDSNLYARFQNYAFSDCTSLTTLNNFSISKFKPSGSTGNPWLSDYLFRGSALVGDISLGSSASVGTRALDNTNSTGILYIHLTQDDTSLLASSYSFGSGSNEYNRSFNPDHCRLVVPYSADHSILTAYQTQWPNYSTIMIEESQS